ncbi:tail fiber assembly protein [Rahnella sp. SAP-1]|uniref:Tail fiber assembly protein n=1 Tax=Rouxiella aceris TaxID=2703884 RepID=A0A848MG75_9GAMM|nr:tail fiber assembly protein [Rouxiella aceris]NMP27217.1 tail fiber assembly protein [Rouxiella aceris]
MIQAILNKDNIAIRAGEITVFSFDGSTREYLSSSVEYLATGVGVPANACIDKPLENKAAYAVCRTADFSQWEYVPDHRGERIYNTENGMTAIVMMLGDYPIQSTCVPPVTQYDAWNGKAWVTDINAQNAANIEAADVKKQLLLTTAQNTISEWQSELLLGVISDNDKALLTAWLAYIKVLKTVDASKAPDIVWPEIPA